MALERGTKVLVWAGNQHLEGYFEAKAKSVGTKGPIYKIKFDNGDSSWFLAEEVYEIEK